MALSVKVGSFSTGTAAAGNTVVVNDVGFTPKAIIFWYGGSLVTTDNLTQGNVNRGWGYTTGTADNFSVCSRSQNANGTAIADRRLSDTGCVCQVGDGSALGDADLQSFDAG